MKAIAQPRKGIIELFPGVIQPFTLRTAYALRMGGWSPFGLLPKLDSDLWPDDLWQGDEERGKHIANRRFTLAGCDISFSRHIGWFSKEGSTQWLRSLHSFSWMRDVVAYENYKHGEHSRNGAKLLRGFAEDWIFASDRLHPVAREPDVMGERLTSWVLHGPLLQKNAQPVFRRRLLHSMVRQALVLLGMIRRGEENPGLAAIKGVLYVALTLPQCGFLYHEALQHLQTQLGALEQHPQARNPHYLHTTLRSLIDIQTALRKLAQKEDARLNEAIFELGQVLQHILHHDGGFALFNGAIEGRTTDIEQTITRVSQAAITPEAERAAQQTTPSGMMERSGYARLTAGASVVLVDVAAPDCANPDAYYGTLSFEFSHGLQRYVVNCGAFIGNDPTWSRVVKTTAAHSTVCVDDRNSCQFRSDALHLASANELPSVSRRIVDRDGYAFFEGIYNGYVPYSGLIHTRQLLMNDAGTRYSGADHLEIAEGYENSRSHDVNLRFHLHPSVQVKRLMNGMVLLTSADGAEEWTFQASVGQAVELEEGIYLGLGGKPVSTTQIVIYAPFNPGETWALEWSFIKN